MFVQMCRVHHRVRLGLLFAPIDLIWYEKGGFFNDSTKDYRHQTFG
jgi:hypothetical protein